MMLRMFTYLPSITLLVLLFVPCLAEAQGKPGLSQLEFDDPNAPPPRRAGSGADSSEAAVTPDRPKAKALYEALEDTGAPAPVNTTSNAQRNYNYDAESARIRAERERVNDKRRAVKQADENDRKQLSEACGVGGSGSRRGCASYERYVREDKQARHERLKQTRKNAAVSRN